MSRMHALTGVHNLNRSTRITVGAISAFCIVLGTFISAQAIQGDLLTNGGFETGSAGTGWQTTDPNGIEVWPASNIPTYSGWPTGSTAYEGTQFAELNASQPGTLYQDVVTVPGETLTWTLAHRARGTGNTDVMRVLAGPGGGTGATGLTSISATKKNGSSLSSAVSNLSDSETAWGVWEGTYVVPSGQTLTRFGFQAVSSGNGNTSQGNFLDAVAFGRIYTGPTITITYDAQSGSVTPTSQTYTGTSLSWPTPTRTGYTFDGWFSNSSGGNRVDTSSSFTPTASATYFAHWTPIISNSQQQNTQGASTQPELARTGVNLESQGILVLDLLLLAGGMALTGINFRSKRRRSTDTN